VSAARVLTAATSTCGRRPLLICYLPVGDPAAASATAAVYVDCGVDVIEAGLPVRHPVLDGPEVAESMARAIDAGIYGQAGADLLATQLERAGTPPAVWMSYCTEPSDAYLTTVVGSGAGGVLLPDAEPSSLTAAVRRHGLCSIPFLDHKPRAEQVRAAASAEAYVMVAAACGVSGARPTIGVDNREILTRLRASGITAPLTLGFGITQEGHARRAIDLGADGVIVGSACLRAARAGAHDLRALLRGLRRSLDG